MEMTVKEALIAARAKIADPAHWTQGSQAKTIDGYPVFARNHLATCWCSIGAIYFVDGIYTSISATNALKALEKAMGKAIFDFNDTHTHAEVLAKLDEAITAQGGE